MDDLNYLALILGASIPLVLLLGSLFSFTSASANL